ncbi:MAG: low molecular weight phosphotyrosine protein phosphatase [Bacteroidales bacterium]|nr:low molecular weight phosphotyrosine protein phosphatase [Bacteroidales bacterium]
MKSYRVLFICHGNICRSPMAEFIFKDMVAKRGLQEVFPEIDSCAVSCEELGNPVYPPARAELAAHGISCKGHAARQITRADHDRFDLIFTMDASNMRILRRSWSEEMMRKVQMLLERDVADPWYTRNFKATWNDILRGCEAIIEKYT